VKLLYVCPSYPPMVGGGERLVQALAEQAVAAGHQVTVVTSDVTQAEDFWHWRPSHGRRPPYSVDEGPVRVVRCPAGGIPGNWPGLLAWRKAMITLSSLPGDRERALMSMARRVPTVPGLERALAKLEHHDLVHGFNMSWEHALLAGWRHARTRGVPFVVRPDIHLGTPDDRRIARNNTMAHQLRVLSDADATVVNTSIERDGLIALGVRSESTFVVGSGFTPAPVAPNSDTVAAAMQRHGLADPLVLFIGRVSRDKGAIDAARAVLTLGEGGARAAAPCLALVGAVGRDFRRYYGHLSPGARMQVRPLGMVSEEDKHALLSRATALVLPSRVDSFGIVLLEAWAHGKPVIGARAGGIPGVIDHELNGLLVDWGDADGLARAIAVLLSDPQGAARMGTAGRDKMVSAYTWEAVFARLERVYRGVLSGSLPSSEATLS
jgi:glycogen synthase